MTRPTPPTKKSTTPTARPETTVYRQLPELVSVERDSYVFVALLEDPSLGGPPTWLVQTLRVDPTDGGDDELVVRVTERCHVDAREDVAFEDQYTIEVPIDDADRPLRVESIRDSLERQYVVCDGCGQRSSARIFDDRVAVFTPDGWCDCEAEEFSGESTPLSSEKRRVE